MSFYIGQPEPRCKHDSRQPAQMCTECGGDIEVMAWHIANYVYLKTGELLSTEVAECFAQYLDEKLIEKDNAYLECM